MATGVLVTWLVSVGGAVTMVAVEEGKGVLVGVGSRLRVAEGITNVDVTPVDVAMAPVEVGVNVAVAIGGLDNSFNAASRLYFETICGTPPETIT